MSIYEFSAKNIKGEEVSFEDYKGKVLLIVNTASKCGFTPQYEGLEKLYQKYKSQGLEILAFPCNQFGKQEPGTEEEIAQFCDLNFKVSFPLYSKVDVNGEGAHPLFKYLKSELKGIMGTEGIKWNFTKFLVGKDGTPHNRYAPKDKPEALEEDIQKLLGARGLS